MLIPESYNKKEILETMNRIISLEIKKELNQVTNTILLDNTILIYKAKLKQLTNQK